MGEFPPHHQQCLSWCWESISHQCPAESSSPWEGVEQDGLDIFLQQAYEYFYNIFISNFYIPPENFYKKHSKMYIFTLWIVCNIFFSHLSSKRSCNLLCFAEQEKSKLSYISILSEEESACADWASYFLFTHQPHQFPFCSTPVYFLHYSKNDLKSDCITHLLKAPRCFPTEHRIRYKLLTKAFKDGMRERVKMRGEGYEMSLRWNQDRSWLCPSHLSNSSHTST